MRGARSISDLYSPPRGASLRPFMMRSICFCWCAAAVALHTLNIASQSTKHANGAERARSWSRLLLVAPTNQQIQKKHTQHTQHEYNYTHAAPAACFGEGRAHIAGASYACNASVNDRRQYVPRLRAGSRIVDAKSARRTVVVVHRHIAFTTRSPRAMKINVQSARE